MSGGNHQSGSEGLVQSAARNQIFIPPFLNFLLLCNVFSQYWRESEGRVESWDRRWQGRDEGLGLSHGRRVEPPPQAESARAVLGQHAGEDDLPSSDTT